MSLPEALHLHLDGTTLTICDAQLLSHVEFKVGNGDPCEWSQSIVLATCKALDVTAGWDGDDEAMLEEVVAVWHGNLGAEDGFLP